MAVGFNRWLRAWLVALVVGAIGPLTAIAGPFTSLVVFGDSLSDVGNISSATFGSTPGSYYSNGRFSNGPVYAESLAIGLGLPALTRSTGGGNDFAYGGAQTTGTGGFEGIFIRDLDEQVSQYLANRTPSATALHVVFAGANDLIGGQTNVNTPVNKLISEMGRLITGGARRFLVFNLPPLGETPRFNGNATTRSTYNTRSQQFNSLLSMALDGVQSGNAAVTINRLDVAGMFAQVLAMPADFGLVNVTQSAAPGLDPGDSSYNTSQLAPNPNQYLFWDDLHPTAAVHAILAQRALDLFRLPGDFNRDNVVDGADYVLWRKNVGAIYIPYDYKLLRSHFGETDYGGMGAGAFVADAVNVPEPATAALIAAAALSLAGIGRRRVAELAMSSRACRQVASCVLLLIVAAMTLPRANAAEYVIHISVDGLRPSYLQTMIDGGLAPTFKRLQDEGAWTMNARTDYSYTITLPNHTSMLTSRPVEQPEGRPATTQHGYIENSDPDPAWTLHNHGNLEVPYKASVFDVVHDAGLSTSLHASKSKFSIFDQSYNEVNGAENIHGRDKIDKFFALHDGEPFYSQSMQTDLIDDLETNPTRYTFVHYTNTDTAGHTYGWGSEPYNNAIAIVDGCLAEMLSAIETNPVLAGRTSLILSADHGGEGFDHSDPTLAVDYTIPFFAWGAGVGRGDLYAFNSDTRADPGTSRVDYLAAGQPIRNGDGGNLALSLLELGPIPGSLINYGQDLRVTMPGDYNADNQVDGADYVAWRRGSMNPSWTYELWRAHFGEVAAEGGGAAHAANVPEPASAGVAMCAALVCMLYERRRR